MNYEDLSLNLQRMHLYIMNTRELYNQKKQIIELLRKRIARGQAVDIKTLAASSLVRSLTAKAHKVLKQYDGEHLTNIEVNLFRKYIAKVLVEEINE